MRRWSVFWLVAAGALVVRLYLAALWFRFGTIKLEMGWLATNPVRGLLTLVASGQTPMPIPGLSIFADRLLAMHADVVLSVVLPLTELALATAFLTGCWVRVAAVIGIAVNAALILGGLASVGFDGPIIGLQALLLIAGAPAAGVLGLPGLERLARAARPVAGSLEATTGPEPGRRAG